jgi:hypothetical protein
MKEIRSMGGDLFCITHEPSESVQIATKVYDPQFFIYNDQKSVLSVHFNFFGEKSRNSIRRLSNRLSQSLAQNLFTMLNMNPHVLVINREQREVLCHFKNMDKPPTIEQISEICKFCKYI